MFLEEHSCQRNAYVCLLGLTYLIGLTYLCMGAYEHEQNFERELSGGLGPGEILWHINFEPHPVFLEMPFFLNTLFAGSLPG